MSGPRLGGPRVDDPPRDALAGERFLLAAAGRPDAPAYAAASLRNRAIDAARKRGPEVRPEPGILANMDRDRRRRDVSAADPAAAAERAEERAEAAATLAAARDRLATSPVALAVLAAALDALAEGADPRYLAAATASRVPQSRDAVRYALRRIRDAVAEVRP